MAELYDQNKIYANRPTASSQAPQSADAELEAMLAELPPEEREAARAKITAAPTGEDINRAMQERNANGEVFNMSLDQYRLWKSYNKTKEVDVLDAMGTAAEGVFEEIMKAAGSVYDKPLESTAKLTPSLIEAFAQGTRSLYGMAAQSQDPNSVFFRVKNAITANGDDEEAEFQQFMDAQAFNVHSMRLATGQDTIIMDKDVINPEMTQVMSYIADPTLFVPFGGIAAKGARMVGMGETLAKASARASQIQRKVLGGAIKWGVGAPIEFMGTAVRNTIDYGLERAGTAFEVATGMPVAEARTTAQMYGWYTASAALEGRTVGLPVVGDIAGAMVGSTTARGVGEALTMVGEQIQKQEQFGRGILSYAGQALRDANKSGVPLSKHAKALLNVLDKVDPLFVYSADISKGAAEGMVIGAGLGYLSAGEEGAASGAGAGMALGAAGAGMGAVVADVGNGRLYDRIGVQRQMVIEGLRQVDPQKATAFEALVKTAELTGNREIIAQVDGIITGIDVMAPNAKVVVRDADAHIEWLRSQKIDPDTGRLMEPLALFPEFGTDRKSRAKALSFLSFVGNRFDGDHKLLIKELQSLPQDHALRKQFLRLSDEQKKAVFDALDKAATPEFKEKFGGKNGYEFYGDLNYAEANVARINAAFDAGNKTQANEMIRQFLKDETGKDGKLSARGQLLKDKLATEGYFDKDGNMRPSRLKDVEMTAKEFKNAKGFVFRRDSTGQVELHINLKEFGKETLPHELFHAVMLDSILKPDFIDRLSQNLLGKFDANGKRIENASVDIKQVKQFFQRYIDALHGKNSPEAVNEAKRLEVAIKEYESRGTTNKLELSTKDTLEGLLEEFGAYYFGAFINDKPVDYLFRGGELGAMREIMGNAKQGFLDFWRTKIKGMNPDFNFDPASNEFIFQAFEKEGVRTKNKSLDLLMRDFVRATAMANKQGGFDISRLSPAARETFVKNNGIRGLSVTRDANGNVVRSPQRKVIQEQMKAGREIYKILAGLDPKFRQGLITDGEGNLSGRLSPEAMEAMVQSGHIDRAWVDKIQQAYNILDGKGGNVIHFGYLGRTAQIGDYAWPRLVGSDVPFKNRQAVLLGVDFKVGKDGKMYSLFHTLDKAVIDGRADVLWSDPAVRTLWGGDRGAMEADFFRYLANASKAAGDTSRVESAVLLEDGTGAGGRRRDVLHQMLGIVKAEGDVYFNKPIAEIPYGIRHSVTTFNVDGIANMRVGTDRWNVVPENAFKDLSRNFQPSEMAREETPNGAIIKHPLGYKFAEKNGKVRAFDKNGNTIGVFDGIEQAAEAAKRYEGKLQVEREQFTEEVRQEQDKKMARFQPIEDATRRQALQPDGDLFSTDEVKAFTKGTRVVKQTQQEFVAQYVQEMLKPENRAKLNELIEQSFERFRELREIEKQLNSEMEQLTWDSKSNQEEMTRIQNELVELISELKTNPNTPDKPIIEYFAKTIKKKEELIKRSGEIIAELEAQGITDRASEYYKTKMAYESYEQGKLSPEVAAVFLESQMQKVYNENYATGVPVTFVANHGTPNYALIASKLFDVTRLGENTGSASAKRATFFAGSDRTAINYVGVPLEPNWVSHPDYAWYFDWDRIKKNIERNYSNPELIIQNTEALFNDVKSRLQHHDTSKGAKNEIEKILAPLEAKSRTGERLNVAIGWLERLSNHLVDVGTTFGGSEMYWKDAGRPPHLMRQLVKMTNPFVFEYRRSDFRDVTFNEVIMKATEAGHDGVIFKNARDGGGTDIIYALISNTPNDMIKVFDTAHDPDAVNRGLDDNGNKIMNGRELGLLFQPTEGAEGGFDFKPNSKKAYDLLSQYLYGLRTGKSHKEMLTPELEYVFNNIEQFTKASNDDIVQSILRLGDKGEAIVNRFNNQEITLKQAVEEAKNIDDYTYLAKLKDIRDKRSNLYKDFMRATGQMRKISDKDGRRYNTEGERESRNTRYLQPTEGAEGGRVYDQNSKKFKTGFIGRWAEENQERLKGFNIEFIDRGGIGGYRNPNAQNVRIRMQDNSKKGRTVDVGHITAQIDHSHGIAELSSNIAEQYRGNKLSYALYSEMAERLRSMGVQFVTGQIVNRDGIPIKVREKIIGDTLMLGADGSIQNSRPISQEEGKRIIQRRQARGGEWEGIEVVNELDPKARYQPTEGTDWINRIAKAQRGDAEDAMLRVQRTVGGGAINFAVEHSGDILHRTYEDVAVNYHKNFGYENVKDKVSKVSRAINEILKYGFWKTEEQNYPYATGAKGKSLEQHKEQITKVLKDFADEHAKLPAENDLQKTVKTINKAIGNLDFDLAQAGLQKLLGKLKNEKSWIEYASEGMKDWNPERRNFQPTEIPEKKGTVKIKEGYTRVYHQTTLDNIESIKRNGLLVSKSRPTSESRGVSVSETPFYGDNPNLVTIELQVPNEKLRQANGSALQGDVPASDIIAVHENWHDTARYILNNQASLKEVLNGDMDFMLGDGSPEAKAIEYIKNKYAKDKPRYQPTEGDEGIIPDIDIDELIRIDNEKRKSAYKGKQYTPEQMTFSFIGRYASERPEFIKGLDLMYSGSGTTRSLVLSDSETGLRIGSIALVAHDDPVKYAYIQMSDVARQGRGYGTLLYSELAERLRSEGYTSLDGRIVDSLGRPLKIRETVIDKENRRIGESESSSNGERISSPLHPKAWYQPAEYQGGDDYYKPKKNKFESRDEEGLLIRKASIRDDDYDAGIEHNPEALTWYDIGHYGKALTDAEKKLENKNSGLWYWKDNKGIKTINPVWEMDRPDFTHSEWFDSSFKYEDDMPGIFGRYEKPQYDKKGNLTKRGKISLTNTYRSPISDMADAHFYKEAIANSLGHPVGDFDAYWFGATPSAKREMGYSPKDQLPIKFQPAEQRKVNYSSNDERVKYLMSVIDNVPHYKRAFDSGQLSIDAYKPEEFKDFDVLSHAPDTASTVEQKDFKAQGGVGYPLLFPEEGWASVSRGLEKKLNAIGEQNFKKHGKWIAPMALVLSHAQKIQSARNGTEGFLNIIKRLEDRKVISNATLKSALIHGLKSIGTEINDNAQIGDAMFATYKMLENSTSSGFKQRAKFVSNVAGSIARNTGNLSKKQINALKEIIPNYTGNKTITKKELIPAIFQMFADPLVQGLDAPDKKTGGDVYAFVLFDKPLVESPSSPHGSYKYSVRHEDNSPVRVDLLSRPMKTLEMFKEKRTKKGEFELEEKTVANDTGQRNFPYGRVIHAQPSEAFSTFNTERTPTGVLLKNAAGYVISRVGSKYRVYNPYKAVIGVFDNEEQAKKRIYKEEPRR